MGYVNTIALVSALITSSMAANNAAVEFDKARFNDHETYERLVVEFKENTAKATVESNIDEGVISIVVKGVSLKAASQMSSIKHFLTTSTINDTLAESATFGPAVEIKTPDLSNQFTLKIPLKDPGAEIKAFWLGRPARLVIDAYREKEVEKKEAAVKSPAATK